MEEHISIIIAVLTFIGIIWGFRDKIFSSGGKEQGLKDRIIQLEKSDCSIKVNIEDINKDIKEIKENHLSHIKNDITEMKIKMAEISTTLEFIKNK
jgi:hypothetical protein